MRKGISTMVFGVLWCATALAEPRIVVDNRTNQDVDLDRIGRWMRLIEPAGSAAGMADVTVTVHIWPSRDILDLPFQASDTFFHGPGDIYMPEVDYQSILQGILLAVYPEADLDEIERMGRRIWNEEQWVIDARVRASN